MPKTTMLFKLVACANLLLVTPLSVTPEKSRAFSATRDSSFRRTHVLVESSPNGSSNLRHHQGNNAGRMAVSAMLLATMILSPIPAFADEYGVEKEAPTLFTGETVEICKKRGILGACIETQIRTAENDNDKASKYFRDPSEYVKRKDAVARTPEESEGNALIERLRKQTEDNKEKNSMMVQQKTFENDQSASFGPFDRQVLIVNANGRGFTLLENPQAMRLKQAGFIKDKKFIKQPTQEEIDNALPAPEGPGIFGRIFGGE